MAKGNKGSKRKAVDDSLKQTHGALEPQPSTNMMRLFGISDGYEGVQDLSDYRTKLEAMTLTDLHDHSHKVGIVPLDARDKLIISLERKFIEAKARQMPTKVINVKTRADSDPEFAKVMKKWQAGEL